MNLRSVMKLSSQTLYRKQVFCLVGHLRMVREVQGCKGAITMMTSILCISPLNGHNSFTKALGELFPHMEKSIDITWVSQLGLVDDNTNRV